MSNRPMSLKEFKDWFSEQKDMSDFFNITRGSEADDPNEKYIGSVCRSKVCEQKLLEKIETDDDAEVLVKEFLEEGGSILAFEGKRAEIEVESGTFSIPRFCIKLRKDQ